jgi:hypothetical protein
MGDPSMARFLAYLNANPNLRSRVKQLEQPLAGALRQEAESIASIAADAGFDVSGWNARPGVKEPTPAETHGCCGFMTIGTEAVEKALDS